MSKTPEGKARLTVHIPADLSRKTKVAAASLGISTSELVTAMIETRLPHVEEWWKARETA